MRTYTLQPSTTKAGEHSPPLFHVPVAIQRRYSRVNSCRDTLMTARKYITEVRFFKKIRVRCLSDKTPPPPCSMRAFIGKLTAYQPTGRQRFHLCCKWQATTQSRYKRLIYQGIGSMQHHVAVTAFHLHHPAFQLHVTAVV